jgi:hypothetical protein
VIHAALGYGRQAPSLAASRLAGAVKRTRSGDEMSQTRPKDDRQQDHNRDPGGEHGDEWDHQKVHDLEAEIHRPDHQDGEGRDERHRDQPGSHNGNKQTDVFLDIPKLTVDEVSLKVQGLQAKVSLQAEVLQLLKLNVGVDARLDCVDLNIRGVVAQAQLQVRLDNVVRAIERVLATIDENPEILTNIAEAAGRAVEDVGGGAQEATGEVGKGAGQATKDVGSGASEATKEVGGGAGEATKEVGGGAGEATKEVGGGAGEATKEVGGGAGEATKGIGGSVPGQAARHIASEAGDTARNLGSKAGKKAKDLATHELISALGHRSADGAERIIKRLTTKDED